MEKSQIHLEAIKRVEKIDEINEYLQKGQYVSGNSTIQSSFEVQFVLPLPQDNSVQNQIAENIRFFGINLEKLQECNVGILKLAKTFLVSHESFSLSTSD
jgi:hypothetical protein